MGHPISSNEILNWTDSSIWTARKPCHVVLAALALLCAATDAHSGLTLVSTRRQVESQANTSFVAGPYQSFTNTDAVPFGAQVASTAIDPNITYTVSSGYLSTVQATTNSILITMVGTNSWSYNYAGPAPDALSFLNDWSLDVQFNTAEVTTYYFQAFQDVTASYTANPSAGNATCSLTGGTNSISVVASGPNGSNGPVKFQGTFSAGSSCRVQCDMNCGPGPLNVPTNTTPVASGQRSLSGFDFRATNLQCSTNPPRIFFNAGNGSLTLFWSICPLGFNLEESASLAPGATWTPVQTTLFLSGDFLVVSVGTTDARKFYRLKKSQ